MARRVARHVTGGAALVHDPEIDAGEVVLVTGADLTTIHDQPAPEGSADDLRTTTSTVPVGTDEGDAPTPSPVPPTTTTTVRGYAPGAPPAGVACGGPGRHANRPRPPVLPPPPGRGRAGGARRA